MEKGALIGKGMTAEVYEWEQNKVLKLYFNWVSSESIIHEAEVGNVLWQVGLPSPAVYDIVDVEGRKGIIFQRIYGKALLKLMGTKPWRLSNFARRMANLHFIIHSCSIDKLQSQDNRFIDNITCESNTLEGKEKRILNYFKSLPRGLSVCHGDFHPDNILVNEDDMIVIDWTNAYQGNHLSDVARTCIMITTPFMPTGTPKAILWFSKILKSFFCEAYLCEYIQLSKVKREDIEAWMLPVAAARLREKIPGEEKWLLGIINKELNRLGI
ncbi:MAG: phosphotransferase [Clostridiaceae bacterium]|nr:phosphotransferase [Clostridiaceae bacterium]